MKQRIPATAARLHPGPLAVLLLACVAGAAGSVASASAQKPAGDLQPNPTAALRAFEPAANQDYELGRGDEISIDFSGRPEMNGKHVIGPDGRITLPLAGSILVADKTREQAADAIASALSAFYSHLSLTVGVDRYTSNRVLLLGAVEHPGVLTFDETPTLLEVITRGGVPLVPAPLPGVSPSISPRAVAPVVPERCAIYRGTDKVMWVDLKGLLDSGSSLAGLRLKRDDVVYVPSPAERYISVLGQVQHPGAIQLENNTTLAKLIAEAGGLTPQAGRYPDIQVIQPSSGATRVISFKAVLQPGTLDLTLKPGDVVFIPESGFNRSTYVLERLSPLVTMFTAAAFFAQ